MHEAPRQQEQQQQNRERVIGGGAAGQVECEGAKHRAQVHPLQAIGAPGQPVQLVGKFQQDQCDTQRHHQARQVAAALDGQAADQPEHQRRGDRDRQADQRIGHHVLGEQGRRVGAQAEEGGVAERHDAGVSEHQVQRHREQRHDRDLVDQCGMAGQQHRRNQRDDPQHRLPRLPAAGPPQRLLRVRHADFPARRTNRPCGRQIRITIIRL